MTDFRLLLLCFSIQQLKNKTGHAMAGKICRTPVVLTDEIQRQNGILCCKILLRHFCFHSSLNISGKQKAESSRQAAPIKTIKYFLNSVRTPQEDHTQQAAAPTRGLGLGLRCNSFILLSRPQCLDFMLAPGF